MAGDSPAIIIFDEFGNPVGVNYDGYQYRLLSDSRITDGYSIVGTTTLSPGVVALKVDVVKSVSGGGVGIGGTSSNFVAPFPTAGTAAGYYDGYYMQSAQVFDLDTSGTTEFVLGTNLRTFDSGGSVEAGTSTHPLRTDPTGNTVQPVSGTVTADQGTSPWITSDVVADGYLQSILANQTNGTQHTIVDGYVQTNPNVNVISFPNDVHVEVDGYVQTNPNVNVTNFPVSQIVSGTVTSNQGTSPWITKDSTADGYLQSILANQTNGTQQVVVDGYVQTNPNVIATGHVSIDGYVQTNPNVNVTNFPVSQIVSGTVTSNQGTTPWLVQDNIADGYLQSILANQTNGTQQVVVDGYVGTYYANTAQLDAFSRVRVSEPKTLFDSKQIVDNQPLFWDDQQVSGSNTTSTYNTNQASTTIAVAATTAGYRVRQTFQRFQYQPGKGSLVAMTGVLGSGHSGITKTLGLLDGYNGLFFQLLGTTLQVGCRTYTSGSVVNNVIPQSSWNIDKFDGTGISGIVLDITKTQIFVIDFQWLGVGRIRFGFDINGILYYCHEILNSNNNTVVYMANPNLPLRYAIQNDGTGPASNLTHICGSVVSEGGREQTGFVMSADWGTTSLVTLNNSNIFPLIALRLKSAYYMSAIDLLSITTTCTSGATFRYCLLLNPTITGTALSFSDVTNSAVQIATPDNGTTLSSGTQLYSGYLDASSSSVSTIITTLQSDLKLGTNIAGTSDIVSLGISKITGTTETFYGGLSWREKT